MLILGSPIGASDHLRALGATAVWAAAAKVQRLTGKLVGPAEAAVPAVVDKPKNCSVAYPLLGCAQCFADSLKDIVGPNDQICRIGNMHSFCACLCAPSLSVFDCKAVQNARTDHILEGIDM